MTYVIYIRGDFKCQTEMELAPLRLGDIVREENKYRERAGNMVSAVPREGGYQSPKMEIVQDVVLKSVGEENKSTLFSLQKRILGQHTVMR